MPSNFKSGRAQRNCIPESHRAYLSLGSNLGDSRSLISEGMQRLGAAGIKVVRVSSLYKTEPVEFLNQPWFINCVVEIRTSLSPRELLRTSLSVERALGRRRRIPKGPRLIDIDILLYENIVVRSSRLTIPHPRMTERRFVLVPLRELAPRLVHPVLGETIATLLSRTTDTSKIIKV